MSSYGLLLIAIFLTVYSLTKYSAACAGFVSDRHAAQERVEERLQNATEEPTTGVFV